MKTASRHRLIIAGTLLLCLQWMALRAVGAALTQPWSALLPGLCIVAASFLMAWTAEAAERDIPQGVAVGIVALIAVLPEYAVDIYFAWTAGKDPSYAAYAAANMTGANRLLIGVGWTAVLAAFWWFRGGKEVRLSRANAPELATLAAATAYSFLLPLKRTLSLVDAGILLSLFAAYTWLSSRSEVEEPEIVGPGLAIADLPKRQRRWALSGLFLFAAAAISLSAAPFAEGILDAGRRLGIEEFLLVQWLAPLASEAPEFIVAVLFATKGRPAVGLRTLISSKVNQWTVLVGMLPLAYGLSTHAASPLPLAPRQAEELLLTSAQSAFGLLLLMDLRFTVREGAALFALFAAQLFIARPEARLIFAAGYLGLSALLLLRRRTRTAFRDVLRSALDR